MKILMVSNFYPPHYRGGYEVRCKQVAETMQQRGHEIRVLTSVSGLPMDSLGSFPRQTEVIAGVQVDRWLNIYAYGPQPPHRPWTFFQAKRQLADARRFVNLLSEFKPDIVNWWSMNGLAMNLLPIPGAVHIPDVHWIEHPWMIGEYGAAGEKVAPFWESVWDGRWGPRPFQPLFRWLGRQWEQRVAREGLPLSLVEAMACGLPCVVTDVGGNREVVQHGSTGLVVEAGGGKQLAGAIAYLLDHPEERRSMGQAARSSAHERFNLDRMNEEYKAVLFHETCSSRPIDHSAAMRHST